MQYECLPLLYSRTSTGAVQQWTIEIDAVKGAYRASYGQVNGKIVTTEWTNVVATNVGRANERDLSAQAQFQAQAIWKKKKDSGCFESIEDIDKPTFIEPMLAKKWEDVEKKTSFPLFCQPKLDGMRAVITRHGAFTRNGKPWLTIPHILEALESIFTEYPDIVLDGELYNHDLKDDFNKISSLVKKTKPSAKDLAEAAKTVEFWWYDCFSVDGVNVLSFTHRKRAMLDLAEKFGYGGWPVTVVPSVLVHNKQDLDNLYGEYLDAGFEGQMIRVDAPYENKRSANLLKRKEFQDDEYLIVEICEGNGNKSGMAGYATLERSDGKRFSSNIKGNHTFLKELLHDADSYKGKYATCKYFNLTPDGIPRFPYVIGFRDGKGID